MKNKKTLVYIILIIIAALITMLPMFLNDYTNGHDTKFHVGNIQSITQQLKSGNLQFKIVGNMGNNFGYGTGLFYPPLPHVSAALINLITNNTLISIRIVYFIGLIISGITMFFLSKKLSNSNEIALLSAIIYMVFPYHISNIYIRDAQNESLLFAFLPLIVSGLYELFKNNNHKKFYILFISGYVFAMLTHLTMMVYFTAIILVFLIFKYKKTFENIKPLVIASILILMITSFFWVPLMEQKLLGNYRVFQDGVMVQGTWGNALSPLDYINLTVNWKDEKVKYFIDAVTLVLLAYELFNFKKVENKFYRYVLIFGIISFVLSTKIFPWDIFPKSLRIMQFPWRFVSFLSLSVSLIAPLAINSFKDKKVISYILCILIILLSQPLLHSFSDELITLDNIDYEIAEGWQHEYLPVNLYSNYDYYENRTNDIINLTDIESDINIISNNVPKLEFSIETNSNITIELPRIYYIGYTLKDENGKTYKLYENENGFIQTTVGSGNYTLNYTGTKLDILCNILSIIGLFGCIVIYVKK
jgi:uncharacterized membrane protein